MIINLGYKIAFSSLKVLVLSSCFAFLSFLLDCHFSPSDFALLNREIRCSCFPMLQEFYILGFVFPSSVF